MIVREGDVDRLLPPSSDSRKSVSRHRNRKKFFKELDRNVWGIDKLEKLIEPTWYDRMQRKILNIVRMIKQKIC